MQSQVCLGQCSTPNLRICTHLTIHSAEKDVADAIYLVVSFSPLTCHSLSFYTLQVRYLGCTVTR